MVRSRPGKPNQKKGRYAKFMNFTSNFGSNPDPPTLVFFPWKKKQGKPTKKARVSLFAEPLKSLEKKGKTPQKSKEKKARKSKKSKDWRVRDLPLRRVHEPTFLWFGLPERLLIFRKAPDTFKCLRHAMRAILSVRPKCSHRCVAWKETPLKPVQILNRANHYENEMVGVYHGLYCSAAFPTWVCHIECPTQRTPPY